MHKRKFVTILNNWNKEPAYLQPFLVLQQSRFQESGARVFLSSGMLVSLFLPTSTSVYIIHTCIPIQNTTCCAFCVYIYVYMYMYTHTYFCSCRFPFTYRYRISVLTHQFSLKPNETPSRDRSLCLGTASSSRPCRRVVLPGSFCDQAGILTTYNLLCSL